jgi:hypothetical protein
VVFPNIYDVSNWCFRLPVDFDMGGISSIDGEWKKEANGDLWNDGASNALDFCTDLTKGMHLLEVFGSSTCCDRNAVWKFQVNGGEWLTMSSENLNTFLYEPTIEGTTIMETGMY